MPIGEHHPLYHYSITCEIHDEIVLACIRAICQCTAKGPYPQIGWGGTGLYEWKENNKRVSFRFTHPSHRERFVREANRLFEGHWKCVDTNDSDPATPQKR